MLHDTTRPLSFQSTKSGEQCLTFSCNTGGVRALGHWTTQMLFLRLSMDSLSRLTRQPLFPFWESPGDCHYSQGSTRRGTGSFCFQISETCLEFWCLSQGPGPGGSACGDLSDHSPTSLWLPPSPAWKYFLWGLRALDSLGICLLVLLFYLPEAIESKDGMLREELGNVRPNPPPKQTNKRTRKNKVVNIR